MDSIMPTTTIYFNTLSNVNDIPSLIKFYDLMFITHPFWWIITCVVGIYAGLMLDKYYGYKARVCLDKYCGDKAKVYLNTQKKHFMIGVDYLKR